MIYRLSIPTTFEDNDSVRILEWHGAPGDAFAEDGLIVEFETHKALVEVRAGQAGILRALHVDEGAWCPLGTVIALFSDAPDEPLCAADRDLLSDFRIG